MMTRYIFAFILLSLWFVPVKAQTIADAQESNNNFRKLYVDEATRPEAYQALLKTYEQYVAVLHYSAENSVEQRQAKLGLKDIQRFLGAGAAYFNQKQDNENALKFAEAMVNIPMLPEFRNDNFDLSGSYAQFAMFAASENYNHKEYQRSIPCFQAYLLSGEQSKRRVCYEFMAQACVLCGNNDLLKIVVNEGLDQYPDSRVLIEQGIMYCIQNQDYEDMQTYLTLGLAQNPDDSRLLANQGLHYERLNNFEKALEVYKKMREQTPNSLNIAEHIALNNYNLAVSYYMRAKMGENDAEIQRDNILATEYFNQAAVELRDVVQNSPNSLKYVEALATCYANTGNTEQMLELNERISTLGGKAASIGEIPLMISYNDTKKQSTPIASAAATQSSGAGRVMSAAASGGKVPLYSEYAKSFVNREVNKWQNKDPFETIDEYKARVNEQTYEVKKKELLAKAEQSYIETYAKTMRVRAEMLELGQYDADNQAFLVNSKYGALVVPVPRDNDEALLFQNSFNNIVVADQQFRVSDDELVLANVTLRTPAGKEYRSDETRDYKETVVNLNFVPRNDIVGTTASKSNTRSSRITREEISVAHSDIDENIPETDYVNNRTFALIVSNEAYNSVASVPNAINDGSAMSNYCQKVLGLPSQNVQFIKNATYGQMVSGINRMKQIAESFGGDINIIFYYAGHGIPNEATKDSYLLPVDADGRQTDGCYSLDRLYKELGSSNANSIVCFLDACFSGSKREGDMLNSARGIAITARKSDPRGNMVVFSAATDDQTAYSYKEKAHGLFTYFLLKKLQESAGNVTLEELGDYVRTNVSQHSIVVNQKPQTPTVNPSHSMIDTWRAMRFVPEVNFSPEITPISQ